MKTLSEILEEIASQPKTKGFFIHKPSNKDISEYENTMAGIDTIVKISID